MIQLKGIEKNYHNKAGVNVVLKNISFEVKPGEYVMIMGKSGSGKSTLLNILTGVDKPSKGEVTVGRDSIVNLSEGKMAEWRGKNVGIIFQFFQLIPTLSVLENILLPMDLVKAIPPKHRKDRAMRLLEKVGLEEHANKMPCALSGGEQQRVAIARALANDIPIIVADEPTGNLDSKNAEMVFELFHKLNREGKTVILVTHEREMIKGPTRKILLKDGELIKDEDCNTEVKAV